MLRVTARAGLLSGQFRVEGLHVIEGQWAKVDPRDPKARAALLAYVPSHVRIAPAMEAELAAAQLAIEGGRLVDLAPPPPPKKQAPKQEPKTAT